MSNVSQITDHVDQALDRLVYQFKDKTLISGLITSFVEQNQTLENVFDELFTNRILENAMGQQLDNLGTIVGQERNGENDDDYRIALQAKIGENNSKGTPESLIAVFNLLTGSTFSQVLPAYPAEVGIFANVDLSDLDTAAIFEVCQRVIPGGVRLYGIGSYNVDDSGTAAFGFEGDANAAGFGDANDSTVGGAFATLYESASD